MKITVSTDAYYTDADIYVECNVDDKPRSHVPKEQSVFA